MEGSWNQDGLTINDAGEIYYADTLNNQILRVDQKGRLHVVLRSPPVWTLVPDDEETEAADLSHPYSIACDGRGSVYFVQKMSRANRICVLESNGRVSVVATIKTRESQPTAWAVPIGQADARSLYHPTSITHDRHGNLYFAEAESRCVKRLDADGNVTIVAGRPLPPYDPLEDSQILPQDALGGDGRPAEQARLLRPSGLAIDGEGNLYISDALDNCVRKVDSSGHISTFAGTTLRGFSGDGGLAINAQLNVSRGLAFDQAGNLYIADEWNHRIRRVDTHGRISTVVGSSEP